MVSTKSPRADAQYVGEGDIGDGLEKSSGPDVTHPLPRPTNDYKQFFSELEANTQNSPKTKALLDPQKTRNLGHLYAALNHLPTVSRFWFYILYLPKRLAWIDDGQAGGEGVVGKLLLERVQGGLELFEKMESEEEKYLVRWSYDDIFNVARDVPIFKHADSIATMLYIQLSEVTAYHRKTESARADDSSVDTLPCAADLMLYKISQFAQTVRQHLDAEKHAELEAIGLDPRLDFATEVFMLDQSEDETYIQKAEMPKTTGDQVLHLKEPSRQGHMGILSSFNLRDVFH